MTGSSSLRSSGSGRRGKDPTFFRNFHPIALRIRSRGLNQNGWSPHQRFRSEQRVSEPSPQNTLSDVGAVSFPPTIIPPVGRSRTLPECRRCRCLWRGLRPLPVYPDGRCVRDSSARDFHYIKLRLWRTIARLGQGRRLRIRRRLTRCGAVIMQPRRYKMTRKSKWNSGKT